MFQRSQEDLLLNCLKGDISLGEMWGSLGWQLPKHRVGTDHGRYTEERFFKELIVHHVFMQNNIAEHTQPVTPRRCLGIKTD